MGKRSKGPAVVDGLLVYTSPSAMMAADVSSGVGCVLKWWYRYVDRRPQKPSKSKQLGNEIHDQAEHYLKTGQDTMNRVARTLRRFMPEPGDDLLVEHWIEAGELDLDGVPIVGKIDLCHRRPTYVEDSGLVLPLPPGSVVVKDWKSTSDFKWVKPPETLQTDSYGEWARRRFNPDELRIALAFCRTKGRPESVQVSRVYDPEEIKHRWHSRLPVLNDIREAARCDRPDQVKANTDACEAFGGCDYFDICERGQNKSLADWLGDGGAMDLLDQLPEHTTDISAEVAALEQAEKDAAAGELEPYARAVEVIDSAGMGFPTTAQAAADVLAKVRGLDAYSGSGLAGTGKLSALQLTEPEQLKTLADELVNKGHAKAPKSAGPGPGPLTPPATDTTTAPVETPAAQEPQAPPQEAPPTEPQAPAETENAAQTAASPVEEALAALRASGCRKKQREEAADVLEKALAGAGGGSAYPAAQVEAWRAAADELARLKAGTATQTASPGVHLHVDSTVQAAPQQATPLAPYVDTLRAALREQFKVRDIRSAPTDSPLGYNKWRGVLAALVRERPPAPGVYYYDARGNEVAEIVVDALLPLCATFTRGSR